MLLCVSFPPVFVLTNMHQQTHRAEILLSRLNIHYEQSRQLGCLHSADTKVTKNDTKMTLSIKMTPRTYGMCLCDRSKRNSSDKESTENIRLFLHAITDGCQH